ncbi:type 1 glutamine amidotransferase [Ornithinibacillus gellani]|uniref:type 1 glutamine amidotransferase domain-containing protein n=1 Tax=Ornithinibacillus gellani TaxID=2293253 RepID=UPI000F4A8262|nr:type 1 glutamine amidotransferase domain-containing protein [Ornithinibacillus gellani]TQS70995.1 type 1 glutamine amidotransferase [Ornithinibacillus gellani]
MQLKQKKVISLVANDYEDLELWYPVLRLQEAGAEVHLAGAQADETYLGKHGLPAKSNLSIADAAADQYDAIVVPGGWAPDKLRQNPDVIKLIQQMDQAGKPIGIICHAGWVLVSADILKGRKATSTPAIKDDMIHAGANWVDEPVVVDGHLVSSRRPPDLPVYMKTFIELLVEV